MELVAATLQKLGGERALVVHGAGGLDEISLAGKRWPRRCERTVQRYTVTPEDFGVARAPIEAIAEGRLLKVRRSSGAILEAKLDRRANRGGQRRGCAGGRGSGRQFSRGGRTRHS